MAIAYTKTATTISLVLGFRPIVIPSSHPNFNQIADLAADPNTQENDLVNLIDIPKAIETFTGGNITVTNGRLFYKGFEVKSNLAKVILGFVKSGQPEAAKPFENFLEKAYQNPDPRAVEGLYDWVVAGGLPITPDGDILAWKAVQSDYYSTRAGPNGKLRHMIGDTVEEPRERTNANPDQTCGAGIHFCSVEYITQNGYGTGPTSRIMAVTISPSDVVAFPRDYNLAKGRCHRLTVVGEVPIGKVPNFYPADKKVYADWQTSSNDQGFVVGSRWTDNEGDVWQVTQLRSNGFDAKLVEMDGVAVVDTRIQSFDSKGRSPGGSQYTLSDRVA